MPRQHTRTILNGILYVLLIGLIVSAGIGSVVAGLLKQSRAPQAEFQKDVKPLLSKYCQGCHNNEKHKGDFSLQAYPDQTAIRQHAEVWAKVLAKVRDAEMPPEGKTQPSQAERATISSWIDGELFPVDPKHPDPGRVTIRRLNRAE